MPRDKNLKTGPAAITLILAQTDYIKIVGRIRSLLGLLPIAQYPPIGSSLILYRVPL